MYLNDQAISFKNSYQAAIVLLVFLAVVLFAPLGVVGVSANLSNNNISTWGGAIIWYWNMPFDMNWIAGIRPKPKYVILDPDSGVLDNPWTVNDLNKIKASGAKVIGYLNIGFAEEWRDYWNHSWTKDNHPEWLLWTEYPGWEGEHFVKYWHPSAWQPNGWIDILKYEIKKIISLGFDGIIFDNIDSYTAWEEPSEWDLEGLLPEVENASNWMIYLVGNLSAYARSLKPDIIIIANMGGGLPLLYNKTFLASLDAVLEEEVWYSDNELLCPEDTEWAIEYLDYAVKNGLDVIILDYAWTSEHVLDDLNKAITKGYYIYVASSYELNTLAPYVPSYSGLTYIEKPYLIIAWSYHGMINNDWLEGFDVYIAHIADNYEIREVQRLSTNNSDDVFPSISYSYDHDKLLIIWQTDQGSHDELEANKHWWLKGALLDPSTLKKIKDVEIESNNNESLYYPSLIYYDKSFYVFYEAGPSNDIEERDIYYSIISPDDGNIIKTYKVTSDGNNNHYPRISTTPQGIAVVWISNNTLNLALIDKDKILWKTVVDENVVFERYTVLFDDAYGIIILYQKGDSAYIKVYDLKGRLITLVEKLPSTLWFPQAITLNNYIVYTGINNLVFVKVDDSLDITKLDIETDVSGTILRYDQHRSSITLIKPSPHGNNKLDINRIPVKVKTETNKVTRIITTTRINTFTSTTTMINKITKTKTTTIYKTLLSTYTKTATVVETDWIYTLVILFVSLIIGLLIGIFSKKLKR